MTRDAMLNILEETLKGLSVKLVYDDLRKGEVNTRGGLFTLKGERCALIHKGLSVEDKVELLLGILSTMDTESLHLPPAVRKKIEEARIETA